MLSDTVEERNFGTGSAGEKFFTLKSAGQIYGLSVEHAQTIFRVLAVTPIPLCRPEIVGFLNLRGKIRTAVSLRRRFGLGSEERLADCFAICLEKNSESFALIVDQVGDVVELAPDMKIEDPAHCHSPRSQMTSGLFRMGSALVPILDIDAILDFERH